MPSTVKTIVIWVLILVVAVALYSYVDQKGTLQSRSLTLTEFLDKIRAGEVDAVVISESRVRGQLANKESFRSTIPDDYGTIYDLLTSSGVQVTIEQPQQYSWLPSLPPLLVLGGSILWLAISAVILVVVVDLSKFVKRQLARTGSSPSGN